MTIWIGNILLLTGAAFCFLGALGLRLLFGR